MPRRKLIVLRKGTAAEWAAANPTIAEGEPFFVTDIGEFGVGTGAVFTSTPTAATGGGAPLVGSALGASLDAGCTNQPREVGIGGSSITVSGTLGLSYFRAPRAFTAANMAYYTGATAAGATPTLVKYALFSVAANGDLTRIAVTASDTALFAAASTRYPKALLASAAVVPGQTYATGMLLTTAAATPTLISPTALATGGGVAAAQAPRLLGAITGQTDINASYAAASVVNTTVRYLAEITT